MEGSWQWALWPPKTAKIAEYYRLGGTHKGHGIQLLVNGPYRDWTQNFGVLPTLLWPGELTVLCGFGLCFLFQYSEAFPTLTYCCPVCLFRPWDPNTWLWVHVHGTCNVWYFPCTDFCKVLSAKYFFWETLQEVSVVKVSSAGLLGILLGSCSLCHQLFLSV